jgi:transcription antitermination factor NusG
MTNSEDAASEGLTVGSLVRVIRVPYFGQRAVITALPRELERIETGASARVAKVTLEADGSEVTVPRANLELA